VQYYSYIPLPFLSGIQITFVKRLEHSRLASVFSTLYIHYAVRASVKVGIGAWCSGIQGDQVVEPRPPACSRPTAAPWPWSARISISAH
jgi:hypothetical protein